MFDEIEQLRQAKTYSDSMRALSELEPDDLTALQMLWGLVDIDRNFILEYGDQKYGSLPGATIARINAMKQTIEALDDEDSRERWANRIEGRPTQKTVNVNGNFNSIDELEAFTTDKLNKLFDEMDKEDNHEQVE